MWIRRMAIGAVIAAGVLATASLAVREDGTPVDAAPAVAQSVARVDGPQGLLPLNEVIELWQTRADAQPLDYISRTNLGVALAAQAKEAADLEGYEDSERVLREALDLNPIYRPGRIALASTLIATHDFAEARELATAVAAEDPTSLGALALVGDASLALGDVDGAATVYYRLGANERSAPVISRLARLAATDGDAQGAVTLAEEALRRAEELVLRPDGAAFYHFQLGHFRFAAGDAPGAIAALEEALELSPTNPAAREKRAFVLASTGELDAAGEAYAALLADGAAADLHGLYADVLRLAGDTAGAEEQERLGHELAIATLDGFPAERRHLAEFFTTRDPALAVELAEADLATRQDAGAYDTLAWALHHAGRHDEAATMIDAALATGTKDAAVLYHGAAIADATGDRAAAAVLVDEALARNPHFHPTDAAAARRLQERLGRAAS